MTYLSKGDVDPLFNSFETIIHLVALFSNSFRDNEGGDEYWVDRAKIRQLASDEVLLRIYLGLLYQQIKMDSLNYDLTTEINLMHLLGTIGENWDEYHTTTSRFISKISSQINLTKNLVNRFNQTRKGIEENDKLSNRERNFEMFNAYYDIAVSMLNIVRNLGYGMNELVEGINTTNELDSILKERFLIENIRKIETQFISKIEDVHKIGVYVFNKQYAGAIGQTFLLMNSLMQESKNYNIQLIQDFTLILKEDFTVENYHEKSDAIKILEQQLEGSKGNFSGNKKIIKLSNSLTNNIPKIINKLDSLEGMFRYFDGIDSVCVVTAKSNNNLPYDSTVVQNIDLLLIKALKNYTSLQPNFVIFSNKNDEEKKFSEWTQLVEFINIFKEINSLKEFKNNNRKRLRRNLNNYDNNQWQAFLKYGTFMANMATADSPEDVTAAIEAVAAPPGSYSIKRKTDFNISINGYLGGFAGREKIHGITSNWFENVSVSAPVGIYFGTRAATLGIGRNWRHSPSIGLFMPIIDLGTIASFRFTDDGVDQLPSIKLKNIVAPGAFLEIGIPATPFSISGGVQYGASHRNIDPELEIQTSEYYKRYGLSLKVDIPIFYLKK